MIELGIMLEVLRRFGQSFQDGRDEFAAVLVGQVGIGHPLFAQRRRRGVAQMGPAQGARTVRRKKPHAVGQLGQFLGPGVEHQRGQRGCGHAFAQQIGPAYAADEQRVAAEEGQRLLGILPAVEHGTHAVGRVARRIQEFQDGVAHGLPVTLLEQLRGIAGGRLLAHVNRDLQTRRQFHVPGHEIRVGMGQPHARDRGAFLLRRLQVLGDVAPRVDHPRLLATDEQVGVVREDSQFELDHLGTGERIGVLDLVPRRLESVRSRFGIFDLVGPAGPLARPESGRKDAARPRTRNGFIARTSPSSVIQQPLPSRREFTAWPSTLT